MGVTFPGQSAEYRAARDRLLEQEIELRRAMEAVAFARRRLPPGGVVPQDYVFQGRGADNQPTDVGVSQRVNLAVAAKAPLSRILAFAAERGWRRLRLLSSSGSTYNRDYLGETAEGHQRPMLNVFHRDGGTIRHSWGSEPLYAPTDPGQDTCHVGTIEPLWNLYDLTPEGRGTSWDEQLSY